MMTNEMQDYRPNDPPPPPPAEHAGGYYSPWSADPTWGPPTWPPSQQAQRGSGFRRTALAVFAIACVGAGGGTAWALTTTAASSPSNASNPSGSTGTNQNPGGSLSPSTGSISAATVAQIDSAVVDITGDIAGTNGGEVAGTGMIITSNGEVLTNNHVIDDTVDIHAQIDGIGTVYQVKVIGYDASDDVALVQLTGSNGAAVSGLPTVPIGDSSALTPGDSVTVLGNAEGKGGTPAEVTGTVTSLGQQITASDDSGANETLTNMIQVSAAIEPGDSGGPELNSNGKVIGMTTAGQTSGNAEHQTASTVGFAIPIDKAMEIISEIRAGSGPHIHIGYAALLGVEVSTQQPVTEPDCATSDATTGAWVSTVIPNGPASGTSLAACGRITGIGGLSVANQNDLHNAMESFVPGQTVTLTWLDSSAQSHSATITLGTATFPD
jgi:S1-C subfamily serine protease